MSTVIEKETSEKTASQDLKTNETPVEVSRIRPVTDIYRNEDQVRIVLDLPGASEDQVEVSVHDGELSIKAEVPREHGELRRYERSFRVDRRMDTAQMKAVLQRGVLSLSLPFHEEAKPRRIEVLAG
ncbi:Hsp20/alpha crystallin family protein [Kiritimatiellota bacterium B12222]|nr:Hsp20/alpha crystallin family protein [Kiritimatiellota bacterium B12222]